MKTSRCFEAPAAGEPASLHWWHEGGGIGATQGFGSEEDLRPLTDYDPPSPSHNSPGSHFTPNYLSVFNDSRDSWVSSNSNQWAPSTGSWFPWWHHGDEFLWEGVPPPPDVERLSDLARFPHRVLTPRRCEQFEHQSRRWRFHSSIWENVQLDSSLSFPFAVFF